MSQSRKRGSFTERKHQSIMKSAEPKNTIPTPPFCVNCLHFIGLDSPESKSPSGESAPRCRLFPVLDIVFGERFYIACNAVRGDDAPCATAGKLFELKPVPSKIERIKKAMSEIKGEPCGQPAHQCKNPRHLEYFELSRQLDEERHPSSKPLNPPVESEGTGLN